MNASAMKIRTITTGIPNPFSPSQLQHAAEFNTFCRTGFEANGYEVQSTRCSCQVWDEARDVDAILRLESDAQALGIEFLSLGTIFPETQQASAHLTHLADVIVQSETLFASVTLTAQSASESWGAVANTAKIIQQIAQRTDAGYGNLRFAALMNCPPNTPFFPAAYWQDTRTNFGIGWQAADLVNQAFHGCPKFGNRSTKSENPNGNGRSKNCRLGRTLAQEWGVKFVGIDVSPAPMGEESIAYAMEQQLPGYFGERGTLTVAAGLTRTLRELDLPSVVIRD